MNLMAGSAFGQQVYTSDWFSELDTLKVTFDDTSIEMWVIEERTTGFTSEGIKITCLPYWTMLARRDLRVNREPLGIFDTTLTIYRKSPQECLDEIFTHNAPPHFASGTVSSFFDGVTISVEANNSNHLELIRQICVELAEHNAGFPAEFVENWSGSTCSIDIVPFEGASAAEIANSWTPDADSRVISGPTGEFTDEPNRLVNKVTRGMSESWNRIIPTAGPKETPVTIGQTFWDVTSAVYSNPSTTITFTKKPFGGSLDIDADETIYFGSGNNWYPITSVSAGGTHTIVVTGDASALTEGRFAVDSEGAELVYLGASTASGDDVFEASAHFDQIVPYVNLLDDAGVSTDFTSWSGGLPVGTTKVGSPTVEEIDVADPDTKAYVRHGDASAKVTADEGEGVRIGDGLLTLEITDIEKIFSFVLNVGVPTGRVRCVLVDSDGKRHPQGTQQAESKVANLTGVNKGGMDAAAGAAYLEVIAQEDGTIFYLDSANITRSVGWWKYVDQMGPRALWKAGREALTQQMISRDFYDTDFIDPKYLDDTSEEVTIGSHVRIKDGYKNGAYRTSVTGRAQEIRYSYSNNLESIKKTVKVSRPRPDFSARFKKGSVTGIPGLSAGIEAPSDFFLSEFAEIIGGDKMAELSSATSSGSYSALEVDVSATVEAGTLLTIRDFEDNDAVEFWTLEKIENGQTNRLVSISANEPTWGVDDSGNDRVGVPDAVTNAASITIPEDLSAGTGIYRPAKSLHNKVTQMSDLFEVLQTKQNNADILQRIAVIGEDFSGETDTISNLEEPPRVTLRKDWQLTIESEEGGVQHVTLDEDIEAGTDSLSIYTDAIEVKEGDLVKLDPMTLLAWFRVEPGEVNLGVREGRKAEGIASIETPLTAAGAPYAAINIKGGNTLGQVLDDGDTLMIQDQKGFKHEVTMDGEQSASQTAINISPSFTPSYDIVDGALKLPDTSSYSLIKTNKDNILLRVEKNDVINQINISTEGITIDGSNLEINASTTFATSYDPSDTSAVIRSATTPATRDSGDPLVAGDTWIDTSDGDRPKTYNGSAFVDSLTIIDGGVITTGAIQSADWSASAGVQFDITNGTFSIGGSSSPDLSWDGATLAVQGTITITAGSGIANLTDAGNLATGDDLDDVGDGSNFVRWPVTGAPPSNAGATTAKLYVGADNLGYWDGAAWATYMDNAGNFYLGGATGKLQWDAGANTLTIDGAGTFSGALSAASGSFVGSVTIGSVISIDADEFGAGLEGITMNDGTYNRVQIGEFSVGTYGMKVLDAAGTTVFDSSAATPTIGGGAILDNLTIDGTLTMGSGEINVGSGNVVIDSGGINLSIPTGVNDLNAIGWNKTSASKHADIIAWDDSGSSLKMVITSEWTTSGKSALVNITASDSFGSNTLAVNSSEIVALNSYYRATNSSPAQNTQYEPTKITSDDAFDIATTSGNLSLSPTSSLILDYATFPASDGTSGQALTTDGAGTLSWTTVSGNSQNLFETIAADSGTNPVADSTTDTLTLTGGTGISTSGNSTSDTVTFDVGGLTTSELSGGALQTSGEAFSDSDTVLMTAAAVDDRILSYGYTTNTGDITSVSAGNGLQGGGSSGAVVLDVAGITTGMFHVDSIQNSGEVFSDSDAVVMTAAAIDDRILSYGYTSNDGDITGVTAGTGLGGGGTSGAVTVDLDITELSTSIAGTALFVIVDGDQNHVQRTPGNIDVGDFNDDGTYLATADGVASDTINDTEFRDSGGFTEYRQRTVTITDGQITAIGAFGSWTAVQVV